MLTITLEAQGLRVGKQIVAAILKRILGDNFGLCCAHKVRLGHSDLLNLFILIGYLILY